MPFEPVSSHVNMPKLEEDVLAFWKREHIFKRSMENRKDSPRYVFYEGPPTANGQPGSHHVLSRAFKDMFPRFQTMRGKYSLRRGGWDTHGLPVEIEVQKQLGISNKQEVLDYGIARFNERCRSSVFTYIQDWERLTDRIGFWVDLSTAYVTFTNDYIESVWWILKQLHEKGLIYQDFKVVPYSTRSGTPLSDHEVALGYQEDTPDPSIFVRFPLRDEPNTSLLVWTTTPWTLPANVAVAAGRDVDYVRVRRQTGDGHDEYLILAEALIEKALADTGDFEVVERFKGAKLFGRHYQPLFTFLPFDEKAHYVLEGDFVTTTDGTGLVHLAPAFGADDMRMMREYDLPLLMTVNERGEFIDEVRPYRGVWFKDADPHIIQDLTDRGLMLKHGTYYHTYPFDWRDGSPLMYLARSTWYIRTTQIKDRLTGLNQTINWYPNHIKDGRFGNWLDNNVDWALARERFWGTPLPIWMDEDNDWLVVGSVQELSELAGRDLSDLDLHRPYVDEITFPNPKTGKTMRRIPEVVDVWFDSGAMPVAQWHYPFENQAEFEDQFPADYICEAIDQTRGWFYSLHAISSLLCDSVSFKNVICLGHILDGEGRKMSKSKGNVVEPWSVLDEHGADALRWYLFTASPPGQSRRFSVDLVGEVIRNFVLTLWNTYSFFVTYANLDNWAPTGDTPAYSDLDRWVLSELHTLTRDVTSAYEGYDVLAATRPVERFVDSLSNWYLRRSRRRFWRDGDAATPAMQADKDAAYATLFECLTTVSKLIAPAMPFLADAMYRNLVLSVEPDAPMSVHMADWPTYDPALIDEALNAEMALVMKLVSLGHGARNKANRKVRQPLAEAAFAVGSRGDATVLETYADIISEELNVKAVRALGDSGEALVHTLHPLPKQLGQKYGKQFPAIRSALLQLDAEAAASALLDGQSIDVTVAGNTVSIQPDEVEVRSTAREGFAIAEEGGLVAALVTELTPALVREGLAREFVRRVQELRKNSNLDIADRITVVFTASDTLAEAITEHAAYIQGETLATGLSAGDPASAAFSADDSFDGETLGVGITVVG